MKKLSIVVPVYYNEKNLPSTIQRLLSLRDDLPGYVLELIFVDDGSGDNSLKVLLDYQSENPQNITVIKLSRNFGAMAALQSGLEHATGDCVGVIAADLQDPPELFIDMVRYWEMGNKVVLGVRRHREDSLISKSFSYIFYFLLRRFAIRDYPQKGFDFMLIDKQVVQDINRASGRNTNTMTFVFWLGYSPVLVPYKRVERDKGISRWTFSKRVKFFIDTFVSFSYLPIRIISLIGILIALIAFGYGLYVLFGWYQFGIEVRGWTSSILVTLFLSGFQMIMLGVVGEYLWRVLDEVRNQPKYVIDEIYPNQPQNGGDDEHD
jgi:glycosyltransferase involved in cell wall biosynthesis